jgi:hypothetical protein
MSLKRVKIQFPLSPSSPQPREWFPTTRPLPPRFSHRPLPPTPPRRSIDFERRKAEVRQIMSEVLLSIPPTGVPKPFGPWNYGYPLNFGENSTLSSGSGYASSPRSGYTQDTYDSSPPHFSSELQQLIEAARQLNPERFAELMRDDPEPEASQSPSGPIFNLRSKNEEFPTQSSGSVSTPCPVDSPSSSGSRSLDSYEEKQKEIERLFAENGLEYIRQGNGNTTRNPQISRSPSWSDRSSSSVFDSDSSEADNTFISEGPDAESSDDAFLVEDDDESFDDSPPRPMVNQSYRQIPSSLSDTPTSTTPCIFCRVWTSVSSWVKSWF